MLKLKELIEQNNLTQKQFADKLGVSESAVSCWIKGTRTPNIRTVFNICKTFNVSSDWLLKLK